MPVYAGFVKKKQEKASHRAHGEHGGKVTLKEKKQNGQSI